MLKVMGGTGSWYVWHEGAARTVPTTVIHNGVQLRFRGAVSTTDFHYKSDALIFRDWCLENGLDKDELSTDDIRTFRDELLDLLMCTAALRWDD